MGNNKTKDYILIGNCIADLVGVATNTLWINFILSKGMTVYQLIELGLTVIGMIASTIIVKNSTAILEKAYSHYKGFLIIEGITTTFSGMLCLITGDLYSLVAMCFIMKPFGCLQKMNNNRLMKDSFSPDERERHDNLTDTVGGYIKLTGLGIGLLLNIILTPAVGVAISMFGESVNNIFYWKQYNIAIQRKEEKERDAA